MADYTAKDASAATKTFKATDNAGVLTPHHNVDTLPTDPLGANADAVVAAGATGSISAKLRAISRDLVANIVLAAGSAIIGKVGIDQTTPGTTNGVQVNAALPAGTNLIGTVTPYAARDKAASGTTGSITDTTSTQVMAGVASNYLRITQVTVQNSHASVDTWVYLQDGSGGTTLYSIFAPHGGGGAAITLPVGLLVPTLANGLYCACVTTGAAVRVSASGYAEV